MAGIATLKGQLTGAGGKTDFVDRNSFAAGAKPPFSGYGGYAPALQTIYDQGAMARGEIQDYSPNSSIGLQRTQLLALPEKDRAAEALRNYERQRNVTDYLSGGYAAGSPMQLTKSGLQINNVNDYPTGEALVNQIFGKKSPPTPLSDQEMKDNALRNRLQLNDIGQGGGAGGRGEGNSFQVGQAQQIGAPRQNRAPLTAAQGGGLRASMTATGQGPMIGAAGGGGGPGGQSAPTGNLYSPPDDAQGQQAGQIMGRLMANLFSPK